MDCLILIVATLISPYLGLMFSCFGIAKGKNWRIYITFFSLILAILAFNYIPTVESDIVRYFKYVEYYGSLSYSDLIEKVVSGDQIFIGFSTMCWISGKLGSIHFLPAISVFFVYFTALYITCKYVEDSKGRRNDYVKYICMLMLALGFYYVVNNIRNVFAFSMIALAVFREIYQGKKSVFTYCLYILPIFIHSAALVLVMLRFALKLSGKLRRIALIFVILAPIALNVLETLVINININNPIWKIFKSMIIKGNGYYTHTDAEWSVVSSQSGSILLTKIFFIILIVAITYIAFKVINKLPSDTNSICSCKKMYFTYFYYLCLITIACFPMVMPEYWRFASLVLVMGGPTFYEYSKMYNGKIFNIDMRVYLYLPSIIIFVLWFRNMCLYSDVMEMLLNSFFIIL